MGGALPGSGLCNGMVTEGGVALACVRSLGAVATGPLGFARGRVGVDGQDHLDDSLKLVPDLVSNRRGVWCLQG